MPFTHTSISKSAKNLHKLYGAQIATPEQKQTVLTDIQSWLQSLSTNRRNAQSLAGFKYFSGAKYGQMTEPDSQVSISNLIALVWIAMQDPPEQIAHRQEKLLATLSEFANFNSSANQSDPVEMVFASLMQNVLAEHPAVKIIELSAEGEALMEQCRTDILDWLQRDGTSVETFLDWLKKEKESIGSDSQDENPDQPLSLVRGPG